MSRQSRITTSCLLPFAPPGTRAFHRSSFTRTSLEQLLPNTHAPLRRYITRFAGADLADEILRETSLKIFRKLPFLGEPAVFRPWTFRIALRIAFSHLKRARRWQPLDGAPLDQLTFLNPNLGEPPDQAFLPLLDHVSPAPVGAPHGRSLSIASNRGRSRPILAFASFPELRSTARSFTFHRDSPMPVANSGSNSAPYAKSPQSW